MHDEIGAAAGSIWKALHENGELTLAQLKKEAECKSLVFDWALGWLAREDKIVITSKNRSFTVRLKGASARAASAD